MRLVVGSEHAGFYLKETIRAYLQEQGHQVIDIGTNSPEAVDYPDICRKLGATIVRGDAELGVVICGSGAGVCIAVNKVRGIRASVCHDTYSARNARADDDANVLCLGARAIGPSLATELVSTFVATQFSNAERHRRRVGKVLEMEANFSTCGQVPRPQASGPTYITGEAGAQAVVATGKVKAQNDALGEALVRLGVEFPQMVVLSPDVSLSTKAIKFRQAFPERFVCTGITEQNTLSMAAGLTSWEYVPVVPLYSAFASGKAADQLINSIAYPRLNVKIVATHGGINVGADGPTHQAVADLGIVRSIPGMIVLAPADASEVEPALRAALCHRGPVYIRLERAGMPTLGLEAEPYIIGRGLVVRPGADVTLAAIGGMVWQALLAADQLAERGISARVLNMRSVKPVDSDLILRAAQETWGIVTAEDHNRHGGLRSAVAEVLAGEGRTAARYVALEDTFAESGSAEDLRRKYCLDAGQIAQEALALLQGGRR